ncbi:hypothetical protein BDZ97DRAFT_1916501 [Flammula alnicola]|nr:hypothetical protein BDZ97DRAFT_1916501 [Flammula alnicola]
MPASRSKKYARCIGYQEEVVKAPKARQPKKALTEQEKEDAEIQKTVRKTTREAKKQWEETLVPWTPNNGFRFPIGTMALYKSDAKSAYSVTEKEMLTLRYESIPGSAKTFFAQEDVKNLARRKFEAGANKLDVRYDQVKGELKLFKKMEDSNRSRRKNFVAQFYGYLDPSQYRHRY